MAEVHRVRLGGSGVQAHQIRRRPLWRDRAKATLAIV